MSLALSVPARTIQVYATDLARSKGVDVRRSMLKVNGWTPAEKPIEEQERPTYIPKSSMLDTKLAINKKKMVSRNY